MGNKKMDWNFASLLLGIDIDIDIDKYRYPIILT